MDLVSEEFIATRMAEPLEKKLHERKGFFEQQKSLSAAWEAVNSKLEMSQELWKLFDDLEDKYTTHTYMYGKEAYCLGIEDGVQMGT